MAVTNLLKTQVDQPVFEWMRPAPTATSATSCFIGSDLTSRYMYYIIGQAMWRYDTYSDSWQEAAPPNIAPVTAVAAKYSAYSGHRGHCISATSTSITIGGLGKNSNLAQGLKIRIIGGKGAGQERTINAVSDGVIHDFGLATTATANTIGDSTKKWRVNQWDAYSCRLTFNTGQSQLRRILYNDTTTLTFSDANLQAMDSFNNTGFSAVAPFAIPVTTAGSQTNFVIESTTLTVDSSWSVTPDASSVFMIMSGGIWLFSSAAATPFCSWQYYDILTDTWQTKTPIGPAHLAAAFGTDMSIDRTGEAGGVFLTGKTASSGTARTLVDTGETNELDRWANYQIRIVGGTGIGQRRRIVGNTADTFYVERKWDVNPDSTSQYEIYGDTDKMRLVGNGSSCMWQYSVEEDIWANGNIVDAGIARNISATPSGTTGYGPPHEGYAVSGIVYSASGVLTVAVNAAGSGYTVGDLVTLSTTGTGGTAWVTSVGDTGNVTGVQLAASGSGYSAGSSATTGGTGTSLTITITVGKVGNVTIANSHDFRFNDDVIIAGCATDTTFNGTFTIIGVGSLTTFSIANPSGTASPTAANSNALNTLVDAAANWDVNEHVGKLIFIQTTGVTPTAVGSRRITANTATTITCTGLTPVTGTSRYVIQETRGLGAMVHNKIDGKEPYGWASSGSATTLVDSTKSWDRNQYINCRVRVIAGTGLGNDVVITGNTATTLTVASWNVATPDATSKYEILDTYGVVTTGGTTVATVTDANKNYTANYLAGKRLRIVAGTGVGSEFAISSNTATVITLATTTTTDTTSIYEVYEIPLRSTGIDVTWLFGLSDTAKKGRWLISPRGGASNIFDIYDIPKNTWELTTFTSPNTTTLTTGSMYAYDGADTYIFTKDATGRIYELDLSKFAVNVATTIPYAHNTAALGARMEIINTADNLKYLYVMRHTGQEMWRTLKFW